MKKLLTGIEGLDDMLYGGFSIPEDRGFIIQIKGDTGTGKTILALQMATNYAKGGKIACYFYLEKQVQEVFDTVNRFGWGENRKEGWPYSAGKINRDINKRKRMYENGGMLIGSLSTDNLMVLYLSLGSNINALSGVFERNVALREKMSENERKLEKRLKEYPLNESRNMYIVDPVDIRLGAETVDILNDDRNYPIIARGFKESGGIYLLISNKSFNNFDTLSDSIIELGFIRDDVTTERYMEVIKARNQDYCMGKRKFKISDKEGVVFWERGINPTILYQYKFKEKHILILHKIIENYFDESISSLFLLEN